MPPGALGGRVEAVATLAVVATVLGISAMQAATALRALAGGGGVPPAPSILLFSLLGLAANLASALLLQPSAGPRASFRAALAHELGDGFLTLAALAGAAAIRLWGLRWVDPALCLATAVSLSIWCVRLLYRPSSAAVAR